MDKIRALRRKHKIRMKRRARALYPHWANAYKVADYLAYCSCWSCRNPRRLAPYYRTLAEWRADIGFREQLAEEAWVPPTRFRGRSAYRG